MKLRRRLWVQGDAVHDLRPKRLVTVRGGVAISRAVTGDVPAHLPQQTAVACLPTGELFAGCGDGKVFEVASGSDAAPARPLKGSFADLTVHAGALIAARAGRNGRLNAVERSEDGGRRWTRLSLPEPKRAKKVPLYTLDKRVSGDPDGVLLVSGRHGTALIEKGRGLVAVMRSNAPDFAFALTLQPGSQEDFWFAEPTPHGVLVLMVANHRQSALAHFSPDGALLGSLSSHEGQTMYGARGASVVGDARAVLFIGNTVVLLRLPDLSLVRVEEQSLEFNDYVAIAESDADRFILGRDEDDHLDLLTVGGDEVRVIRTDRQLEVGPPAFDVGFQGPALQWEGSAPESITISPPSNALWTRAVRNVGEKCDGTQLRISSVLIGARVLDVTARFAGTEVRLSPNGPLELQGRLERPVDENGGLLELVLRGRGQGQAPLTVAMEPRNGRPTDPLVPQPHRAEATISVIVE